MTCSPALPPFRETSLACLMLSGATVTFRAQMLDGDRFGDGQPADREHQEPEPHGEANHEHR